MRFAPYGGDGAEGAFFIAALADAQVCPVVRGDAEAGAVIVGDFKRGGDGGYGFVGCEGGLNNPDDVVARLEAENGVDAWGFGEEGFTHSLGEASSDDDFSDMAFLFSFEGVIYGVEGFRFGGCDEAAGIYYEDEGVVGVVGDAEAGLGDLGEHSFAIDHVFGTAEGYKANGNFLSIHLRI